jgi:hypothetical protein
VQVNLFCLATSHQLLVAKALVESVGFLAVDLANELGKSSRTALVN